MDWGPHANERVQINSKQQLCKILQNGAMDVFHICLQPSNFPSNFIRKTGSSYHTFSVLVYFFIHIIPSSLQKLIYVIIGLSANICFSKATYTLWYIWKASFSWCLALLPTWELNYVSFLCIIHEFYYTLCMCSNMVLVFSDISVWMRIFWKITWKRATNVDGKRFETYPD